MLTTFGYVIGVSWNDHVKSVFVQWWMSMRCIIIFFLIFLFFVPFQKFLFEGAGFAQNDKACDTVYDCVFFQAEDLS